jgi:iron(II)-dependent oxidoreductase
MTKSVTDKERIATGLIAARERSLLLTGGLSDDDLRRQHSPIMSPLVWDLAHIGNYEQLWLLCAAAGVEPDRPELDDLYDAFRHPRVERPQLPILGPADARSYIGGIRSRALDVLDTIDLDGGGDLLSGGLVYGMVVQHEHQHDETMLATLNLRTGDPVLDEPADQLGASPRRIAVSAETLIPGGACTIGTSSDPWAYDNERPVHRVDLPAYWIDTLPVTNGAYADFLADGGYQQDRWWLPEGRAWLRESRAIAPLGWTREGGAWLRKRFGRFEEVPPDEPVQHVCWYEADAYARWAGKRLPTEQEWEKAASWDPVAGYARRFPWGDELPAPQHAALSYSDAGALRPAPVGALPDGASAYGVQQMLGDVWEWTSSTFQPWPGFRAFPYREYSEVFFGADYRVLRGGSWASAPEAVRSTFRNWDYPIRRQIFAGFRCARDAG